MDSFGFFKALEIPLKRNLTIALNRLLIILLLCPRM